MSPGEEGGGARRWKERFRSGAPALFLVLRRLRYALRPERPDAATAEILRTLCPETIEVLAGPFRSITYLPFASGGGLLPKIAGSYEMELHGAVEESVARGYERVINVGAAEGYYAVGYALRLPGAEIFAFDKDVMARHRLRELARKNGVGRRLTVGSTCGPRTLARLLRGRCLVVCDCEGCEDALLDPARTAALAAADLLVELHEFLISGLARRFLRCFEATTLVAMEDRSALALPVLAALGPEQRRLATWEGRPAGMRWAWLEARSRSARMPLGPRDAP